MPRNRSEKETPEDATWRTYLVLEYLITVDCSEHAAAYDKAWRALTGKQRGRAGGLYSAGKLVELAKATYDVTQPK